MRIDFHAWVSIVARMTYPIVFSARARPAATPGEIGLQALHPLRELAARRAGTGARAAGQPR
jgi:hypothetical protein